MDSFVWKWTTGVHMVQYKRNDLFGRRKSKWKLNPKQFCNRWDDRGDICWSQTSRNWDSVINIDAYFNLSMHISIKYLVIDVFHQGLTVSSLRWWRIIEKTAFETEQCFANSTIVTVNWIVLTKTVIFCVFANADTKFRFYPNKLSPSYIVTNFTFHCIGWCVLWSTLLKWPQYLLSKMIIVQLELSTEMKIGRADFRNTLFFWKTSFLQ